MSLFMVLEPCVAAPSDLHSAPLTEWSFIPSFGEPDDTEDF